MSKSLIALLVTILMTIGLHANSREEAICGSFQEPFLFWMWSSMAPSPDINRVAKIEFIEPSEFNTSDGKTLRGYKYISNDGKNTTQPKGYILVVMGNAMVSDQIIKELKNFSTKGYDIYVYDYRGYAKSDGKRRIKAIIKDHEEIALHLNNLYDRKLLYGISLGGVVVLNLIGSGLEYDRAVIDSSPSFLSTFGCPKWIDPVENLPKDSTKLLIITGKKDNILTENMTAPLRESAFKRGAKIINEENYAHPFNDRDRKIHDQRMELILNHLSED